MTSLTTAATTLVAAVALTTVHPNLEDWQASVLWMIIAGFLIAFVLAFAVGANDVANSFGTTVGSGTLTLKQACVLASIFETVGAILLGAKVGATIRKGIIDVEIYNGESTLLMAGEMSAMAASGLWQLLATFLKLPVSGTHSIVGSTIGFSLVAKGTTGVHWEQLGKIVGSWFLSPVLSGIAAATFYFALRFFIFKRDDPITPSLLALPIMYGVTITINLFSVLFTGTKLLGFDKLSTTSDIAISAGIGFLVALCIQFFVVKKIKKSLKLGDDEHGEEALLDNKPDSTQMNELKHVKQPTIMETIRESVSLENSKADLYTVDKSDSLHALKPTSVNNVNKEVSKLNAKFNLGEGDSMARLKEEAKNKRKQNSKRSYSTSSAVRIPPLLQLEKNVVQSAAPVPLIKDIREEIRRNFSEPAMMTLTQNIDADVFEVFINRHKSMITIQRKKTGQKLSECSSRFKDGDSLNDPLAEVDVPSQLEEAFDSSDEEGLVMEPTNDLAVPTPVGVYSGAIEEGFRYLSETNQDVIAIKINDPIPENSELEGHKGNVEDETEAKENLPPVRKMFGFLQILTACFGAFAHGGNDVSNAIGPLIALWIIYDEGSVQQQSETPLGILFYGGVGICCGLWVWGRRVIKTMGQELTELTPSRGFSIELTSALTVLIASNLGLPVSTTHCKVGAVVAVGWVRSRQAVDWKIFRNIVLAWFVTVPISGGLSAIIFACVKAICHL